MANYREIAGIQQGRDWTRGWLAMTSYLPQTDEVLRYKGNNDLKIYEEVRQDYQVKSCFQQRQRALIAHDWGVKEGRRKRAIETKVAERLQAELVGLNRWDDIVEKMQWGVFYGYSVAEVMWGKLGDRTILSDIKVRNRRRFHFDLEQKPRLKTFRDPLGEALPEEKFWVFRHGADNDDEPYGLGLAHYLYWLVFFKKTDLRWWIRYLELFAQPARVGKYKSGATQSAKDVLWDALGAFGVDDRMMIPEDMLIDLIEASRAGTADYEALIRLLDEAIAKVILSQTMTTDNGSSLSQAKVHEGVATSIVMADADLICGSANATFVRWWMNYNYPGQDIDPPEIYYKLDDAPDLAALADLDTKLTGLGYPPTAEHITATYGAGYKRLDEASDTTQLSDGQITSFAGLLGSALQGTWSADLYEAVIKVSYPTIAPDALKALLAAYKKMQADAAKQAQAAQQQPLPEDLNSVFDGGQGGGQQPAPAAQPAAPAFAAPADPIDELSDRLQSAALFEDWFNSVRSELEESGDLVEFQAKLEEAFPKLSPGQFRETMAAAVMVASLGGYQQSNEDADA